MVLLREVVRANARVFTKLAFFSLAMVVLPLATFYTLDELLRGHADRTLWSGLAAATVAYLVCIAYAVSAYFEDRGGGIAEDGGVASARPKED